MMKKILLITTAILLLCASLVNADPWLICDPPQSPDYYDHYEIYQDGALIAATNGVEADGSLAYDLKDIAPGVYEFKIKGCKAGDVWECSDFSNPTISPPAKDIPMNLNLVGKKN